MCDVTTALIASTVVAGAGQLYQADAQSNAARFNAQVNRQNAVLADRRARDAIERGQLEEERKKREGTLLRKQQEASFSAGNIDFNFGSPLDFITSSATAVQMDASIIRANAEREAEDFQTQGVNARNQASLNRSQSRGARIGGLFSTAGTVLNGGVGVLRHREGL